MDCCSDKNFSVFILRDTFCMSTLYLEIHAKLGHPVQDLKQKYFLALYFGVGEGGGSLSFSEV